MNESIDVKRKEKDMGELNVKEGDKVYYEYGYSYNRREEITTVTKVTPTGRIKVECSDSQFDKYGREMGKHDRWSSSASISEATDEIIQKVTESNTIKECLSAIGKLNDKTLDYSKAKSILDILNSK
jgi:hypothetical protein